MARPSRRSTAASHWACLNSVISKTISWQPSKARTISRTDSGVPVSTILDYIDDVLEALEWSRHAGFPDEEDRQSPLPEKTWLDELPSLTAPVTNPLRHVGRNDPCPCGSGKKAKKCCLAN
nr:SEC-C metal-binding domain-containing protein [Mesorhizobium sp.]